MSAGLSTSCALFRAWEGPRLVDSSSLAVCSVSLRLYDAAGSIGTPCFSLRDSPKREQAMWARREAAGDVLVAKIQMQESGASGTYNALDFIEDLPIAKVKMQQRGAPEPCNVLDFTEDPPDAKPQVQQRATFSTYNALDFAEDLPIAKVKMQQCGAPRPLDVLHYTDAEDPLVDKVQMHQIGTLGLSNAVDDIEGLHDVRVQMQERVTFGTYNALDFIEDLPVARVKMQQRGAARPHNALDYTENRPVNGVQLQNTGKYVPSSMLDDIEGLLVAKVPMQQRSAPGLSNALDDTNVEDLPVARVLTRQGSTHRPYNVVDYSGMLDAKGLRVATIEMQQRDAPGPSNMQHDIEELHAARVQMHWAFPSAG